MDSNTIVMTQPTRGWQRRFSSFPRPPAMGKRVVHLSTDRRLLHNEFEGYRLAGADAGSDGVVRTPLPGGALRTPKAPEGRSSLLHARLYALHNALVYDAYNAATYIVDHSIWRVDKSGIKPVLTSIRIEQSAHPPTLLFCDEGRAVFADGNKTLTLFSTGDRRLDDPPKWREHAAVEVPIQNGGFTILDARSDGADDSVHCLLYRIEQERERCVAFVDWVILENLKDEWSPRVYRTIRIPGVVHYCALEPGCESVYIAADRPADFIDKPEPEVPRTAVNKKIYSWTQNAEDITVVVDIPKDAAPIVECTRDSLNVRCGGETLLQGKLFSSVDQEVTTWNVEAAGKLNVCISKRNAGAAWPSLFEEGDANGEQVADPSYVAEVHSRLAHLCCENETISGENLPLFNSQQLEECDFSSDEEASLMRLEAKTYQVTHQVFLNSHPYILTVNVDPSLAPSIGLRNDTDACIWQPSPASNDDWPIRHEGTLLAFGYIQSSKHQKKFTVCSPNFKYSVVCEATRHSFIYRQEWASNQMLRQRNSSGENRRVNVGKQQLISFEQNEDVLGICATDDVLYILTNESLITLLMTV